MINTTKFKCHLCPNEYDSYLSLSLHARGSHNISNVELRKIVYNNNEDPLCKCGCGTEMKWNHRNQQFRDFKHGHHSRVNGGFYSPEGARKSGETRRRRFASGELVSHNKGKTWEELIGPDRAKILKENITKDTARAAKISKSLTGKSKSPEHVAKITADRQKYWGNPIHKREQRDRRMNYIVENGLQIKSNLEIVFEGILKSIGIEYHPQFYVKEIPALFDFKIKGKKILIEADGDFWHSHPLKYPDGPKYAAQISNAFSDIRKEQWAKDNGYTLLRFWEDDITNNRISVIKKLFEAIE